MKHGGRSHKMKHARRNRRKPILIVSACVVVLLAAVYGAGAVYFSNHYLPGTTVASTDISFKDRSAATVEINEKAQSYSCKVTGYGLILEIPAKDISYSYDTEKALNQVEQSSNPFLWFLGGKSSSDLSALSLTDLCASYDTAKLTEIVTPAIEVHNATAVKPANAKLVYDDTSKKVVVSQEAFGTMLDTGSVYVSVCSALEIMGDAAMTQNDLVSPEIGKDDPTLQAKADLLNKSGVKVPDLTLTMGGAEVGAVDADALINWIDVDESGTAKYNESKMEEWARSFAAQHTTVGKERTYTRADGKVCTVPDSSYSVYGWVVSTEEFVELVRKAVNNGERGSVAVPCSTEAATYVEGGRDWGLRYLDVDIAEQYVRYYGDDGEIIWEAPCISGEENTYRATPLGVNVLFEKRSPMVLIGHENGVEIYRTNVSYWMKFMACGVGFHDATWQTQGFGGNWFRQGYGSHGCINLSYSNAESLYGIIQIGDVVVTHY